MYFQKILVEITVCVVIVFLWNVQRRTFYVLRAKSGLFENEKQQTQPLFKLII